MRRPFASGKSPESIKAIETSLFLCDRSAELIRDLDNSSRLSRLSIERTWDSIARLGADPLRPGRKKA
jgi:hypothetical protein